MAILPDSEIIKLIQGNDPILLDYEIPEDWYSKKSLVQPSSLDLHVGSIFIPPKDDLPITSPVEVRSEYILGPGQAVIINTLETLKLGKDISAFGFPPTSVSDRAILMTNPGHIDPGYIGKLNFTLINMGREPYFIKKGQIIITLLLDKLEIASSKSYSERAGQGSSPIPDHYALSRLGHDFLDLNQRMRKTADNSIKADNSRHARKEVWFPIIMALVAAIASFFAAHLQSKDELRTLENRFSQLETKLNIEQRVKAIESKINAIDSAKN